MSSMSKSNRSAAVYVLLQSLDSLRGHFSIYELEDVLICLVFLRFIEKESLNGRFRYDRSIKIYDSNDSQLSTDAFIGDTLNRALFKIEEDNPEFEGIFSSFDFNSKFVDFEFREVVRSLIATISNLDFVESDFGDFFDILLEHTIQSGGKGSGLTMQPKKLSELILSFSPAKENLSVYNPFSGFASLGLDLPEGSFYYGEEINRKVWAFSKLRLLAHSVKNKNFLNNVDVFKSWSTEVIHFDFIVTNPPFNLKLNKFDDEFDVDDQFYYKGNANSFIISQCYTRLKKEGRAVIAIPNGFLTSENSKEKALREFLINKGAVEMVISLPARILNYTSIPLTLLILSNTAAESSPLFVDASDCYFDNPKNRILDLEKIYSLLNTENDFRKQVSAVDIADNNFNLLPARYISEARSLEVAPGYKLVRLSSILEMAARQKAKVNAKGRFVRTRDLSENGLTYQKDFKSIDVIEIPTSGTGSASLLAENSLLLALRSKTLRPTFYTGGDFNVYFPSHEIVACKVNTNIVDLEYLVLELDKDYVLNQIEMERQGTAIPSISREKLMSIQIKVPNLFEQQTADVKLVKDAIVKAKLKEHGLEEQFAQFKKEQVEDLSLKKHNIMQHLNNMQSSIDSLTLFMKQNDGVLEADKVIYPKYGTTVSKRFQRLTESLNEAIYFVDNITNEISFNQSEFINAYELLTTCKEKGIQHDLFDIDFFYDVDTFISDDEELKPIIKFSKFDFFELYNNILENAILHGFTDTSKKYLFKIEIKYDRDLSKIVISFLNNGKPFPKGMAERYQIKGEKAGATGQKGIGSWKVYEIAKHFGAEISVHDLEGEEFPVKIDLLINLENE